MSKAKDEIAKATERGIELTKDEVKLEELREKVHKAGATTADRKAYKAQSRRVADARVQSRLERESRGPATPANDGDAVVRIGETPSMGGQS